MCSPGKLLLLYVQQRLLVSKKVRRIIAQNYSCYLEVDPESNEVNRDSSELVCFCFCDTVLSEPTRVKAMIVVSKYC